MSHISKLTIRNYRGIEELVQEFGDEKFIVLIGRGDSGKSTILSAINAALSPSWNLAFSDLDFYEQNINKQIEIELVIKELPQEFFKESKYGLYLQNDLEENCEVKDAYILLKLTVDQTLEPHWTVKARPDDDAEDKSISSSDRALLAVNYIGDYTDNMFSYNRQSSLYTLTRSSLEEGETIERLKSQLIRSLSASTNDELLEPLDSPLENLKRTAEQLGLNVSNLHAGVDIKENPYTGNSIALHEESLPYRLHGKGSKRLMSIAIQSELTRQGGIVLIDELEQGLEPDRITTLTRILKSTENGQVFITTHSLNVILEADWHNLFIVNKGMNELCRPDERLDAARRKNPQAFFAKKIICCEGKTEQGFIRAFDDWIMEKYETSLSAKGVVIVDADGGNKMYQYAKGFKSLGYETSVFADNDTKKDLERAIDDARNEGITLFLCGIGNCLERQVMLDLPWENIKDIIECDQSQFPSQKLQVFPDLKMRVATASNSLEKNAIREEIISLSINNAWFKHIPGGESLGSVFFNAIDKVDEAAVLKKNIKSLLEWCGITL